MWGPLKVHHCLVITCEITLAEKNRRCSNLFSAKKIKENQLCIRIYVCIYLYDVHLVQQIRYCPIFLPKVPWRKKSHEFLLPYGPKGPKRNFTTFFVPPKKTRVFVVNKHRSWCPKGSDPWINDREVDVVVQERFKKMIRFKRVTRAHFSDPGRDEFGIFTYHEWLIFFQVNVTVNIPWPWIFLGRWLWRDVCWF